MAAQEQKTSLILPVLENSQKQQTSALIFSELIRFLDTWYRKLNETPLWPVG